MQCGKPKGMIAQSVERTPPRFGFNGKEDDQETGWQDYGMRMYNPTLARFFSVDPLAHNYSFNSPYAFAENRPIDGIDLEGAEWTPKHKWTDVIQNAGKGATLIKNLKASGVYKEGMTYAQAFAHRIPEMVSRHFNTDPKPVYQCMNFVTAIITEYAHFYELELNISSDRADKQKERKKIAPDPNYSGTWQDFHGGAENDKTGKGKWGTFSNYFMAWEAYNNNSVFDDVSWDDLQAGDIIATQYTGGGYHAQIVEKVETRTITEGFWFWETTKQETFITITQGSLDNSTDGSQLTQKEYKLSDLKNNRHYPSDSGKSIKARRLNYEKISTK